MLSDHPPTPGKCLHYRQQASYLASESQCLHFENGFLQEDQGDGP